MTLQKLTNTLTFLLYFSWRCFKKCWSFHRSFMFISCVVSVWGMQCVLSGGYIQFSIFIFGEIPFFFLRPVLSYNSQQQQPNIKFAPHNIINREWRRKKSVFRARANGSRIKERVSNRKLKTKMLKNIF